MKLHKILLNVAAIGSLCLGLNACNNSGKDGGGVRVKTNGKTNPGTAQKVYAFKYGPFNKVKDVDGKECSLELKGFDTKDEACKAVQAPNANLDKTTQKSCALVERKTEFTKLGCTGTFTETNLTDTEIKEREQKEAARKKEETEKKETEQKQERDDAFSNKAMTPDKGSSNVPTKLVDNRKDSGEKAKDEDAAKLSDEDKELVVVRMNCQATVDKALQAINTNSDNSLTENEKLGLSIVGGSNVSLVKVPVSSEGDAEAKKTVYMLGCGSVDSEANVRLTKESLHKKDAKSTADKSQFKLSSDNEKLVERVKLTTSDSASSVQNILLYEETKDRRKSVFAKIICKDNAWNAGSMAGDKVIALSAGSGIMIKREAEEKAIGSDKTFADTKKFAFVTCD